VEVMEVEQVVEEVEVIIIIILLLLFNLSLTFHSTSHQYIQ